MIAGVVVGFCSPRRTWDLLGIVFAAAAGYLPGSSQQGGLSPGRGDRHRAPALRRPAAIAIEAGMSFDAAVSARTRTTATL
jgi:hypothetical protein